MGDTSIPLSTSGVPFGTGSVIREGFDFALVGETQKLDIESRVTGATFKRSIDGPATLSISLSDTDRTVLQSREARKRTRVRLGAIVFELAAVSWSDGDMTLTFEDVAVRSLKEERGLLVAKPNTTLRSDFVKRLAKEGWGVQAAIGPNSPSTSKVQLARGREKGESSATEEEEHSWAAMTRIADEVGWRVFSLGRIIIFAPDSWLATGQHRKPGGHPPIPVSPYHPSVLAFSMSTDIDQPADNASMTVEGATEDRAPGDPFVISGAGAADGKWITESVEDDVFLPRTKIVLTRDQEPLDEPDAEETQ